MNGLREIARAAVRLSALGGALCWHSSLAAQGSASKGTTSFVLDGNRVYAEVAFVRPDGSTHHALAYVDMGSTAMTVVAPLARELQIYRDRAVRLWVGELAVEVPAASVHAEDDAPRSIGARLFVEGTLTAGVLRRYVVVIDYRARTLTLAAPGAVKPVGAAVPLHLNDETGLVAVDAMVDGKPCALSIDNGSAYTWIRRAAVRDWVAAHPTWERGVGAVGASNMMMSGDSAESLGLLVRIPRIELGPIALADVGALGVGPGRWFAPSMGLFDWYAAKNAVLVIGWIGGNVLRRYRLTIDYPARMSYWQEQSAADEHEMERVGIVLRAEHGDYFVAAVATKDGRPTVSGVLAGDRLVSIGTLDVRGASKGAIFEALHGAPGTTRTLVLERGGARLAVRAPVTTF